MTKKIAILITDLRGGGAERVVVSQANELIRRGYRVDVVVMQKNGDFLIDLHPDVNLVSLNTSRLRYSLFPLVRYIKTNKPDIIFAHIWANTIISIIASKFLTKEKNKVYVIEHTTWSQSRLASKPFISFIAKCTMHFFYPLADGVIHVSQGGAKDLAKFAGLPEEMIHVIYNGVWHQNLNTNLDDWPSLPGIREWLHGSHKKILAVGNLKKEKNYVMMLHAFNLLRKKINAKLLILGEGEERPVLESIIFENNMQDSVFLPGFVKNVQKFYASADLFILTSICEGFPMVLLEALAAGTPIVSVDCPSGPREILDNGKYGQLLTSYDPQNFANAMEEALLSTHNREQFRIRAREFSIEKFVENYIQLFEK